MKRKEITDVAIKGDLETPALGGVAVETMGEAIVKAQTPNVDGVSGATVTSSAIIAAATQALEAAGADIAVLDEFRRDTDENTVREDKTLDTDIVIIGAGGAGMAAAIMVQQAGKDFVLLEKMPYVGGNTTKATGGMNAAETHYQKEQGIEDSVELFAADTMKGGHDLNDPALVQTLAEQSAGAIAQDLLLRRRIHQPHPCSGRRQCCGQLPGGQVLRKAQGTGRGDHAEHQSH